MHDETHQVIETADQEHQRAAEVLTELIFAASADKVYSEPVVAGDRTIITAAEIHTGMGFGYGLASETTDPAGHGSDPDAKGTILSWGRRQRDGNDRGPRGGGGGGGRAAGRPVAVVAIDPDGVTVQPVLDRTKIAVTALTTLGAIGLTWLRLRRAARS